MDIKLINDLLKVVEKSAFTHFEYDDGTTKIVLKKEQLYSNINTSPTINEAGAAISSVAASASTLVDDINIIKAPLVGTVYLASSPEEAPFVQAGQPVEAGDTLCLIEAMKMFNEIKAPADGIIADILVEDGAMAEYGTFLFRIEQ